MKEVEQMMMNSQKLIEFMVEKKYTLSNIGLTDKQAFDWTKAGLFLEERKSKYRRKYNAIEYVWLRMIKELREFGLSLAAIGRLKEYLLCKMDIQKIILSIIEEEVFEDDYLLIQKKLQEIFAQGVGKNEMKEVLNQSKSELIETVLCFLIVQTIIFKQNTHLLITKEGMSIATDGEPFDDQINLGDLLNSPYICFPLRHLLSDFVKREDLLSPDKKESFILLSDQETKVLNLLREGNLTALSVRFDKDHQINLIETEEEVTPESIQSKLSDYIIRGGYQEITYKTQNGKISHMKRKTKYK